jgi:large subunit ribosomal protein L9
VGEDDKLFGSVTLHDIEEGIKAEGFGQIERKHIQLIEPIKKLGVHAVDIKLHPEVTASINVEVVKE